MISKKNGFFTFCCSLIPGAGEMYMGFMKRGLSLMSLFFLMLLLVSWLSIDPLLFIMPVIWLYGFFDTHNLRSLPEDEFYALEDDYINIPGLSHSKELFESKYRILFAITLILIGATVLWNNVWDIFGQVIPDIYYYNIRNVLNNIPQIIIGCAIIVLGIYLIRGKKEELSKTNEILDLTDKGGDLND